MWTTAVGVILGLLLFPVVAWALAGIFVGISWVLLIALGVLVQIVSFPFKAIKAIKGSKQLQKKCRIGFGILLILGVSVACWVMNVQAEANKKRIIAEAVAKKARVEANLAKWKDPIGSRAGEERVFEIAEGVKLTMCWIPAGEFVMGSSKVSDATPHPVKLTQGFWLSQTEVTQAQWRAVMGNDPSLFEGNDLPVVYVSWNNICGNEVRTAGFLGKLNQLQANGGRFDLPTEAQWEYAARAGNTGDDDGDLGVKAWYSDNSDSKTHSVGQKQSNAWGLCDMQGNVWEWCADWKANYPTGTATDPTGPTSGSNRVVRGLGRVSVGAYGCRFAHRHENVPSYSNRDIGFRVVRSSEP
jgi:formylglycine-generating enzyme required for sulfatase activity